MKGINTARFPAASMVNEFLRGFLPGTSLLFQEITFELKDTGDANKHLQKMERLSRKLAKWVYKFLTSDVHGLA